MPSPRPKLRFWAAWGKKIKEKQKIKGGGARERAISNILDAHNSFPQLLGTDGFKKTALVRLSAVRHLKARGPPLKNQLRSVRETSPDREYPHVEECIYTLLE